MIGILDTRAKVLGLLLIAGGCVSPTMRSLPQLPIWHPADIKGEQVALTAGLKGQLIQRDGCLSVISRGTPVTVIWPLGTTMDSTGNVHRSDGSKFGSIGQPISLSGSVTSNVDAVSVDWGGPGKCAAPYFIANTD